MKLLKYEGYTLTFEPELLTLGVFKKLHDRDKTKNKSKFIQELGYIYFTEDPRSDYQYITDYKERMNAVIEGEGLPKNWQIDKPLQDAINYYKSFKSTAALLLEDTRLLVNKFRKKLRELDLDATDDRNKPIYTLNTVIATIKQVSPLVKELDEAERTLSKEMIQNEKVRGSAEKSLYEDLMLD